MLEGAGLAQCHTDRAGVGALLGQRGHRQSHLGLGTVGRVGLELQQGWKVCRNRAGIWSWGS